MNRTERGWIWLVLCLALAAAAFGLAQSRGALFASDWLSARLPQHSTYAAGLKAGSLSLWSPLQYGGYPWLATGAVAALYPPNLILHALFPVNTALAALVLLHLLWAAAGTYLLARKWSASPPLAAAAGVAFTLGGLLLLPIAELGGWMAAAWLPWLLILTDRLCSRSSSALREAGLLALTIGLARLAGGDTGRVVLLGVVAYGLYLLLVRKSIAGRVLWLALALALGVMFNLPQYLLAREWSTWSVADAAVAGQLFSFAAWLPVLVLLAALLLARLLQLLLSSGRARAPFAALAVILIIALGAAYVIRLPHQQALELTRPATVDFLQPQTGLYRLYTQERAGAVLSAPRESLSNGLGAAYGLPTANGGASPVPRLYARFAAEPVANTLNLMGVKYYLVPRLPAEDQSSGRDSFSDPFCYDPLDTDTPVPYVNCVLVEIDWYLTNAADLVNGDVVALLSLVPDEQDGTIDFPLTIGSHVAEWAFDRSDVRPVVRHNQASVARTFPARSGNPPQDHTGYVYRATIRVPSPLLAQGISFRSGLNPEQIHIESVTLTDELGERYVLAELAGKSNHVLAFLSEDVAIFENYDLLPRAFLAYGARAVPNDDEALTLLRSAEFDPRHEVLLASAEARPVTPPTGGAESINIRSYAAEKVTLDVTAPAAGYLVLTDAWYPGWQVRVDGTPATLERANVMFRAVYLEPGQHAVEFAYQPAPFRTGLIVAAAALLGALVLTVLGLRQRPSATAT